MNLTIFGATGKTGQLLAEQALKAGHTITALARNPAKATLTHDHLRWLSGDASDLAKVSAAVAGADAVLNTLGQVAKSPKDLQTVAIQNILAAMQTHGVKRLITLTGAGVRDPRDQPKPVDKIFGFLLKLLSPDVIADSVRYIDLVRASDLEWVVVRVPRLVDGPFTGNYRVGYIGPDSGVQISRADVADFMLKQISDQTYLHQAPVISNR